MAPHTILIILVPTLLFPTLTSISIGVEMKHFDHVSLACISFNICLVVSHVIHLGLFSVIIYSQG